MSSGRFEEQRLVTKPGVFLTDQPMGLNMVKPCVNASDGIEIAVGFWRRTWT